MIDKLTAILSINSTAQVSLTDDDYNTINWGDTTVISLSDIETKQAELQAIEDAKPTLEELRASAKAKLIAGEALTEDEANTIVL